MSRWSSVRSTTGRSATAAIGSRGSTCGAPPVRSSPSSAPSPPIPRADHAAATAGPEFRDTHRRAPARLVGNRRAPTPPAGVTFPEPGTHPWIVPAEVRESTFALDRDTAAYPTAQQYVHDGDQPDPAPVRA